MILGLKLVYSLLLIGAFFTIFPILAFLLLRINYFMDEYMRMSMLSFLFLGASLGISFTMLFYGKFSKGMIQEFE
jgi:hypothetical protein